MIWSKGLRREPAMAKKAKANNNRLAVTAGSLLAAIGAAALLVSNLETLGNAWCKYVGVLCTPSSSATSMVITSEEVFVSSGGTSRNDSDECKAHQTSACLHPTDSNMKLQSATAKFVPSERTGAVYVDGNPTNNNPVGTSNIGWFLNPEATDMEVCATVYARTSACETQVDIRGRLQASEVAK